MVIASETFVQIRFSEDLVVLVRSQCYERMRSGDHGDHLPMPLDRERVVPIDVPVARLMMTSPNGRDMEDDYQLFR